jgi:hypothetical protein
MNRAADLSRVAGSNPLVASLALAGAFCMVGCTPNLSNTTRPQLADMHAVTAEIVASLDESLGLAERSPDSEPMVLTIGQVENRSSDVLTKAEQYYLMQSVARELADPAGIGGSRNIRFVMPADAVEEIRRRGSLWAGFAQDREPTHVINGDFRSITRTASVDGQETRRDYFVFEYQIVDLTDNGSLLVAEAAEFEREAVGRLFN